jgi:hypothetical protein
VFDLPKLDRLLTADDFAPLVGASFQVAADPAPVQIELVSLTRKPASLLSYRQPFHLVFRSAWAVLLVDGLYELSCGRFGPHQIFLAALAPGPAGRTYQAVFS